MEVCHLDVVLIYFLWVIAMTDEEDIALEVFLYDEPWSTSESQAFTLSDGIEPESLMRSYLMAGLQFTHIARVFAKMASDIFTKVDISKEKDALTVFAPGIEKSSLFSNFAHLLFP